MTALKSFLQSITRSPEEIRAENLREWSSSVEGSTPIADVTPRHRVRVAGVVQNIRIDPREGSGSIEATFIDGTGEMVARWLGRRELSGITLGVGLVIDGTVGGGNGQDLVVLNPDYRLVPGPEHG